MMFKSHADLQNFTDDTRKMYIDRKANNLPFDYGLVELCDKNNKKIQLINDIEVPYTHLTMSRGREFTYSYSGSKFTNMINKLMNNIGYKDNFAIAGGSVVDVLTQRAYDTRDIDIFPIGDNIDYGYIVASLENKDGRSRLYRSDRAITKYGNTTPAIQYILCTSRTISELLYTFDMGACQVCIYKGKLYATYECIYELSKGTIFPKQSRLTENYYHRLGKYMNKGFRVSIKYRGDLHGIGKKYNEYVAQYIRNETGNDINIANYCELRSNTILSMVNDADNDTIVIRTGIYSDILDSSLYIKKILTEKDFNDNISTNSDAMGCINGLTDSETINMLTMNIAVNKVLAKTDPASFELRPCTVREMIDTIVDYEENTHETAVDAVLRYCNKVKPFNQDKSTYLIELREKMEKTSHKYKWIRYMDREFNINDMANMIHRLPDCIVEFIWDYYIDRVNIYVYDTSIKMSFIKEDIEDMKNPVLERHDAMINNNSDAEDGDIDDEDDNTYVSNRYLTLFEDYDDDEYVKAVERMGIGQ